MEPVRVLHILHSMNRGGAENAIMNYYRNIDRSKVQFDFLLTKPNKCQFEDEILSLGGRVFRVPPITLLNPYPYLKGVTRFFKDHPEFRIVHSHTSSKSFFPLLLARKAKIPVRIAHSHNTKSEKGVRGGIRNLLKIPLRKVATDFCACGKEAAKWLYGEKAINEGKVRLVPNVIEASSFEYMPDIRKRIRTEMGISDTTIVLGCTARFSNQKNHLFLISLFNVFHQMKYDSKLLLLGDGELRHEIEEMVDYLGIHESVIFAGVVPNVSDFEQAMDFFLLPSFNEGIPLSMIEAQISGLFCFASEGVPRETDKTGLVHVLSLDKGPNYWAEEIVRHVGYRRKSHLQDIRDAGYDAEVAANELERFYIEKNEKL